MKKLFTMFFVLLIGVASAFAADTWTVAGTAVNGSSWDPANTANDMTNVSGTTWRLTITGKTLEKGTTYEYKVAKDHSWGEAYPTNNKTFTVSETGVYTIVYTFDSNTKAVSETTTKTGDATEVEHTYTIAGSSTDLFGSAWTPSDANNDMEKQADGTYKKVYTGVTLQTGAIQYKITQDHGWDVAYPSSNATLNISADGKYNVTFTFNPETKAVNATAEKVEDIVITHTYTIAGSEEAIFTNTWSATEASNLMEEQTDGTFAKTYSNVTLSAGTIEYKIVQDQDWTVAYGDPDAGNADGNAELVISQNGTYNVTFTFNPTTHAVAATATLIAAGDDVVYLEYTEDNWATSQETQLEKQTDGTYKLSDKALAAGVEFQFKINETWYGSNTDAVETISSDNSTNVGFKSGGYGNNFTIATAGTWTFVVDVENSRFTVTGEWPATETTKVYILGNAAAWDPSAGLEMNTTNDVNFTYELTAADSGDGYAYFGFTTKLGASSSDWDGIAAYRFGPAADGENYWITDETINTDIPYVTTDYKSIRVPAGVTYTISVNTEAKTFKVAGTLPVEEITDLYLIGEFNDWKAETKVALTKQTDGTFTIEKEFEGAFKFIDNLGNWYGTTESADLTLTETTSTDVALTTAAGSPNFILPSSTWTLTVAADQSNFSVAGTWPVVVVEPELYLMSSLSKDAEDNWITSDEYKFTKDAAGIYQLVNVAIPAATDFKIYDKNNDTWYGGEAEEGSFHWITADSHSDINLIDGKNFYFDVAGTWTFSIDFEAKTMSVAGEWPVTDPVIAIVGEFNSWDATADLLTKDATGKYTITKTFDAAQTFQFVVDGAYLGGNVDNGSEAITESNSTDVAYQAGTYNNFSIVAGTWTFTLDPSTQTFSVTGEWPTTPSTTPEHLYFMGDQFNGWDPQAIANAKAVELTKDGDVFTYSGRVEAGYFCLITADGEGADSDAQWTNLNANYRYGSNDASNQEDIAMETTYTMAKGACTYHLTIGGTYTFTVDFSGTEPTLSYTGTEDAPANDLYLKGDFTDPTWAEGGVQMLDNGDGTFTLADYTFANDALFQVVDVSTNTWYGNNGVAEINASNHENVVIATGYENNFSIAAGTYTFVVDFNNKTMTVSGDFSTPDTGKTLQLRGSFNEWGTDKAFTDNGDGTYSITLNMSKGDEFKVVDATDGDVWYGYNTGDESLFWINGSAHTDIQLTTSDGSNNFYVGVGGTWTLTVDYATKKLNGSRVIENYGVLGDEAIFGSNWADDVVMTQADTNPNVYEATLTAVDIAAGDYDYKVRADQDWGWYDLPMTGNETLNVPADGLYDITFSLNIESHTVEATLTPITSISVTISEAEYATIYYENVAFQIPADVTASTYKVQDGHMVVSKNVTMNPAGQALVLYKAGGGTVELSIINSAEAEAADADNLLVGTIWDENGIVESGYTFFYLCRKNGTGNVGFYFFNADGSSVDNNSHKAYLRVPNEDVPAGVTGFSFDDATTGITGINAEEVFGDGAVYTLNGVRVQNAKSLQKGIYVMNGRKFVVK